MRKLFAPILALCVGVGLALAPAQGAASRVVAIADVHGGVAPFVAILTRAGLIDAQHRWAGGSTVFVQTGDLTDRGADIRDVLDLAMALETQATATGGRVQILLGNHEVMNVMGDTRDVSPEAFSRFADTGSEARRERAFAAARRLKSSTLQDADKAEWMAAHPPGSFEYREAFAPKGRYGRWLRSKPIVARIDDSLFMHAGIAPEWPAATIEEVNERARKELKDWDDAVRWMEGWKLIVPYSPLPEVVAAAQAEYTRLTARGISPDNLPEQQAARMLQIVLNIGASSLRNANGPLWFRGYNTWTDEDGAQAAAVLQKFKARRFVTGHSVQPGGRIRARFGDTFFLIDTGMLNGKFWPNGRPSALEIVGNKVRVIY
jgi:hypothetical protein